MKHVPLGIIKIVSLLR